MEKLTYCTIASANYLPQIMTLRETLQAHHPGAEFKILLCEHPFAVRDLEAVLDERFYSPSQVGCPDWLQMAFYYTCMELNTALKPFFLRTLFEEGYDRVIYFDPDVAVFSGLQPLERMLDDHDVILTPHLSDVLDDDGHEPALVNFNRVGQFNLGFIALRNTPTIQKVLRWWERRCVRDCISDLDQGLFVDQSWANLFPSFVERPLVLRHQGYNMAYWNVFQRELERNAEGKWTTADGPLVFFHFSGLVLEELTLVSKHQNRIRAPEGTPLHAILRGYADQLRLSRYRDFKQYGYTFGNYMDTTPIAEAHRRRFRRLSAPERGLVVNPFASRAYVEGLQDVSTAAPMPAAQLEDRSLRYRAVDKVNDYVKRFPRVHQAAKWLTESVRTARRGLRE